MKILRTVALMMIALMIPAMAMSAPRKAAKKKATTTRTATVAKTSHGISATDICKKTREDGFGNVCCLKYANDIASAFEQRGWKVLKTSTMTEGCGDVYELEMYNISKSDENGTTIINLNNTADEAAYMIQFPSSSDADTFIASLKAFGFKMRGGELTGGPADCYWNGCTVRRSGNNVWFIPQFEC